MDAKQECRKIARIMRIEANRLDQEKVASKQVANVIVSHFSKQFPELAGKIVAGYSAIHSEVNVTPLLEYANQNGAQLCLPWVWQKKCWLKFLHWNFADVLIEGDFGALTPPLDSPEIIPDIVLVPLLGFDDTGLRLGYGGGYYDRTIAKLKQDAGKDICWLGVAYREQHFASLPFCEYDQPLDGLLSEKGIRLF